MFTCQFLFKTTYVVVTTYDDKRVLDVVKQVVVVARARPSVARKRAIASGSMRAVEQTPTRNASCKRKGKRRDENALRRPHPTLFIPTTTTSRYVVRDTLLPAISLIFVPAQQRTG